jgi:UDP-2,3-diacylglucosamine pyrophosphatase LpxH
MAKRKLDIVVISDVHLGTYGCHAKELNKYLKSIEPKILILNGDIIDIWQFRKSYWPESHTKVVQRIVKLISKGTNVYYLTGNHDEFLRKYANLKISNFQLLNKLVLNIDEKKMWFFHGDVFDVSMQYSKWLAKLGAMGYDTLILINRGVNIILEWFGREKYSLSKKIKNSVKKAVQFINDFEKTAIDIAIENKYDVVACGHIHQPAQREETNQFGSVMYLNSGDWIENLTSLEYYNGEWHLYKYDLIENEVNDEADTELSDSINIENLIQEIITS